MYRFMFRPGVHESIHENGGDSRMPKMFCRHCDREVFQLSDSNQWAHVETGAAWCEHRGMGLRVMNPDSDKYAEPIPQIFPGQSLIELTIRTGGEHPRKVMFASAAVVLDGYSRTEQRDLFEHVVAGLSDRLMSEYIPLTSDENKGLATDG